MEGPTPLSTNVETLYAFPGLGQDGLPAQKRARACGSLELESDKAMQSGVFGLVDNPTADLLTHAVVCETVCSIMRRESYADQSGKSMKGRVYMYTLYRCTHHKDGSLLEFRQALRSAIL